MTTSITITADNIAAGTRGIAFLPRIYCLQSHMAAEVAESGRFFERCAKLGFDHILIAGFSHVSAPDAGATSEQSGAHAAKEAPSQPGAETVSAVLRACMRRKLRLMLDLDIGSLAAHETFADSHPDWFAYHDPDDDLPDPRRPIVRRQAVRMLRYEDARIAEAISAYWLKKLQAWAKEGVAGFRCMNITQAPASFWRGLIAAARNAYPSLRFLAWTPGCTPEQLETLAGCGFDATFSSAAWWDYRSPWLAEEHARLNRIAPAIAFPDSPEESLLARVAGYDEASTRESLYRRALFLCAAIGNGMMVPMGFEHGLGGVDAVLALRQHMEAMESPGATEAKKESRQTIFQNSQPAPQTLDLSDAIAKVNAFIAAAGSTFYGGGLRLLSRPDSGACVLLRYASDLYAASPGKEKGQAKQPVKGWDSSREALLIVANASVSHACTVEESQLLERAEGYVRHERIWGAHADSHGDLPDGPDVQHALQLGPADLQLFSARRMAPIVAPAAQDSQSIHAAVRAARIAIEMISPSVDGGRFPIKRTLGDSVRIEADVFTEGHDKLAVALLWRAADEKEWREIRMHAMENDRWCASLPLTRIGRYEFAVEAWRDVFASYRDELEKKTAAGLNVGLELEEGRLLVEAAARYADRRDLPAAVSLKALARMLKGAVVRGSKAVPSAAVSESEKIAALLSEPTAEAMRQADARPFAVRSEPVMRIDVERSAARYASWYELFPRSQSGDPHRHGTFEDVIGRLPAIRAMGFDTLYFTPIHPIGSKHRKGRNNSLAAQPGEPGSPYAIGSEEGGHDAIHPQLGTLEDFQRLREEAARQGLEIALDFAIQCSPDHPWLKEHPEWFAWRPDGSIRYAENPPKKYQDIVNVDFYAKGAIPNLWLALRDVVLYWVQQGVRVFRVDNPHTKPLPFWEWMIDDIRSRYPDTIFLSEAFTRPKMMYRLAKLGFSQSYTYFTWRHSKQEFIEYMTELTTTNVREYFRPHFFVNTPDINPYFLQRSGRPGFLIRAALAATLSGLWGMYSGFELCEGTPIPGKEEYLDSEKYEIRAWDWNRPGNIVEEIARLNRIRSENPALQTHLGIRFLHASNDNILYFVKSTEPVDRNQRFGDNVVLVAINLDPFAAHEAGIELPLREFGMNENATLEAEDLVNGGRFIWHGKHQHVRLDPFVCPYAIWRVRHQALGA